MIWDMSQLGHSRFDLAAQETAAIPDHTPTGARTSRGQSAPQQPHKALGGIDATQHSVEVGLNRIVARA
jgi:hypothetical protein